MAKPIKKSDLKKSWIRERRDRKILIAPEYHLIVTEGEKTEPLYFEGLKNEINRQYKDRISIQIEGIGKGNNTLTLLERAQELVFSSINPIKHVWLVYDKDDFPPSDFDNTYYKCAKISTQDIKYHALYSNECIELWFLLHFEYLQSAIHRNDYYPKLSNYLDMKYQKNMDSMYQMLKPFMKMAIANAKRLDESYSNLPPTKCYPATKVYEIFDFLKDYIKV